jgi:hypothetical protein
MKNKDLDRPLKGYNYYIVMWHMYGLESVVDIGRIYKDAEAQEAQAVWDILSSKPKQRHTSIPTALGGIITPLLMRARYNGQRQYEIYSVRTKSDITSDDLAQMFDADPQSAAESIRRSGVKMFSDRTMNKPVIS